MDTSYYTDGKSNIPEPVGGLKRIKYIVIDVDGTMTDAGIYYDENGNELKKFCTKDAAGFFTAKVCGIKTLVLTGRECAATKRRMKELQVDYLEQQIVDKVAFLRHFMEENKVDSEEIAYIGDDLNDYNSMKMTGFIGCPLDAAEEVKEIAQYVSHKKGGEGAVRDVISYILKQRGQWKAAIEKSYRMGI